MKDIDFVPGTRYHLKQVPGMFHMGSDTELLGRFLRLKKTDHVLDIGCGTGALLLYAAAFHTASLSGIDIQEDELQLCKQNMQDNGVQASIECCRAQEFVGQYEAIICNPPYFQSQDHVKNRNTHLSYARHESSLPPEELFDCFDRLLKDNGRAFLVHRASRMQEFMTLASMHHFKAVRMRFSYDHFEGRAVSCCMELQKGRGRDLVIEAPAYLDQKNTF